MKGIKGLGRFGCITALTALLVAVPFGAGAAIRKEGTWPASAEEKKVSFEFDGKPSAGLQKLAHEAGWSLVLSKGVAEGEPEVHIDVQDQPADEVLEALFAQAQVVARRSGKLITIVKDEAAPAPAAEAPKPVAPNAPPIPTVRGEDRNIVGLILVGKDEVVHDVTVTGGKAIVEGTVTGDLVVVGGSATVKKGGRVLGNASTVGGGLTLDDGARIEGAVSVVGGKLDRAAGAFIGGAVDGTGAAADEVKEHADASDDEPKRGRIAEAAHAIGQRVSTFSLLFVLGCVLLALLGGRMDRMRTEVAARPMRSFALGIVGTLAASVAFVACCVTIIGIPLALIGLLLGIVATYGAVAAILTTLGAALAGHRTQNVYVHLLIGCAILFVVGAIPVVGGLVSFVLAMTAIGLLFTTKVGGLLERKKPSALG